jgi:aminomethyltransferase
MIVTSSGPRQKTARWIADHAIGTGAYVTDIAAAIALPVVQGPRSRAFLKSVVQETDLDSLRFFRFTTARINETELILSRSGYTGELGYELYTPAEEAGPLWEFLLQAGRDFGLQPYGVAAMQSLRIEKGLVLYGNDINEHYTPFHVGLERWIRFDKRTFVGREALLRMQARGLEERWVGLVLESPAPAAYPAPIYSISDVGTMQEKIFSGSEAYGYEELLAPGQAQIGYVTASSRGHTVGQMLALAYVKTPYAWPGCNLLVDVNGRLTRAKVTPTPFFDPQGVRLRAEARDDAVQARLQAAPPPADAPAGPPEAEAPPPDRSGESPPLPPASDKGDGAEDKSAGKEDGS